MTAVRGLALVAALALAGCSLVTPYPTEPREAKEAENDPGPRVAICYDGLASNEAEVRQAAQRECPANSAPKLHDIDWHLDYCPLFLPARATFVCVPKPKS